MYRTILVALDSSEHSARTAEMACDLAHRYGARLHVLHVMLPVYEGRIRNELSRLIDMEHLERTEYEILQQCGQDLMKPVAASARDKGVGKVEIFCEVGDPAEIIVSMAQAHRADLVVLGRRGTGRLSGLMLGSVSHKVVQLVGIPCLIVP
jgi:nucleotide-binding universal stress UspA family protein